MIFHARNSHDHRERIDMNTCTWAQLLEDKDLDDSTSITAKHFRVDFRIPYGLHCNEESVNLSQPVFVLDFGSTTAYEVQTDSSALDCLN